MRMTLFLIAGSVFLLASGAVQAQQRDPGTPATRELPAPPKVKAKRTAQTSASAPAERMQRDSTAKPAMPKKSKSAAAATPRQEKKLPRVDKPAKPSA